MSKVQIWNVHYKIIKIMKNHQLKKYLTIRKNNMKKIILAKFQIIKIEIVKLFFNKNNYKIIASKILKTKFWIFKTKNKQKSMKVNKLKVKLTF